MNKEEALEKIEELQEFIKSLDDDKDVKQEENYCVGDYKNVKFDVEYCNLLFDNDCQINSLIDGDGVDIDERFVKFIGLSNDGDIEIILKGSDIPKEDYDNILWDCEGEL